MYVLLQYNVFFKLSILVYHNMKSCCIGLYVLFKNLFKEWLVEFSGRLSPPQKNKGYLLCWIEFAWLVAWLRPLTPTEKEVDMSRLGQALKVAYIRSLLVANFVEQRISHWM